MSRLSRSRTLLIVLAALLQLSLLPDSGHLGCILRGGLGSCCCSQHDRADSADKDVSPTEEHGCCGGHEVTDAPAPGTGKLTVASGKSGPDGNACHCGSPTTPTPAIPSGGCDDHHKDPTHGLEVVRDTAQWTELAVSERTALQSSPPRPTGPPLHLLYQVFLI